jgi:phenylacetate-CoA ligase
MMRIKEILSGALRNKAYSEQYWSPIENAPREVISGVVEHLFQDQMRFLWGSSSALRKHWQAANIKPQDIKSIADITRLPFVTKSMIRDSQKDYPPYGLMLVDGLTQADIVRLAMTSGTTGKPVLIPFRKEDYELWMQGVVRSLWAGGVRRGDVVHSAFGFTPFVGLFGAHDASERLINAMVVPGGSWDSKIRINTLPALGVNVLMGTPTYLLRLGRLAVEEGHDLKSWGIKTLFVTGEVGPASSPATGARLRDLWHCAVNEFSGVQEQNYFAWSCSHGGYHWNEDMVYAEVLDPETKEPVAEGQMGELVVTDLRQRTHPLVRFPTGDLVGGFETQVCGCGRTLKHFKGFMGRIDDVAKIRGVSVAQSAIEHAIRSHSAASDHYDIEYLTDSYGLDQVKVRVELREPLFAEARDKFILELRDILKSQMLITIEVEVVEEGALPRFELKSKRVRDNRQR